MFRMRRADMETRMQIDLRFGDQLSAICVLPVIFDVPILRLDKLI